MTGLPASLRAPAQADRHRSRTGSARRSADRRLVDRPRLVQGTLFTICATYLFVSGILFTPLFGTPYEVDGYLSPLFSPLIAPDWLPSWVSPGLFILWVPLGFRATCYYYRKAYYRFYFADPPGCAVGEPTIHRRYAMETAFPFILQNLHRYFLYLAFIPLFFLWLDAGLAVVHGGGITIGLGVVILFVNAFLLTGYSLSCHSLRHLVGGRLDCFSCNRRTKVRYSPVAAAHVAEPAPHGVGLDEPDLGHPGRRVRAAARDRRHHRPGHPLLGATRARPMAEPTRPQMRPHDVLVIGAGGAGTAGRDRGQGRRRRRRSRLQVAARQGAHRDGRGRRGGGTRPRRPVGFVAGPLPRHDGRRQAPEQPADGASSTRRRRRTACASSSTGAPCSTGRRTAGSSSGRSVGTPTRASPTSATGPASR